MTYLDNLYSRIEKRVNWRVAAVIIQICILAVPNLVTFTLPGEPFWPTKLAWDNADTLQPGDYVICSFQNLNPSNFMGSAGVMGTAFVNHILERGCKVLMWQAPQTFPLFWEVFGDHWHAGIYDPAINPKYGVDWIYLRQFPTSMAWSLRFITDGWDVASFPEMRFDDAMRDVTQFPIYWEDGIIGGERAVQNVYDIKAVFGWGTGYATQQWKIAMPYPELMIIASGQPSGYYMGVQWMPDIINGMLVGQRGAVEYEQLTAAKYGDHFLGPAIASLNSSSLGLFWYGATIILLNVNAYFRRRKEEVL